MDRGAWQVTVHRVASQIGSVQVIGDFFKVIIEWYFNFQTI